MYKNSHGVLYSDIVVEGEHFQDRTTPYLSQIFVIEKLHFLYNNFIAYKEIIELRTSQLCFRCTQVHCHACIKASRMYDQLMF